MSLVLILTLTVIQAQKKKKKFQNIFDQEINFTLKCSSQQKMRNLLDLIHGQTLRL